MAFSQGSRTRLSFIEEVTFGTTPGGNFTEIPYNTHSLDLSKERVQGNEIVEDRIPRYDRHGNRTAGGDIAVDFRADAYDSFLESAMFSTWDTAPSSAPDELKVGTTPKYFSIEDYAADIDQARLFSGMAVSQASFSIRPNQMVATTFSMVGKNMTIGDSEKTVNSATLNQPFDAYSGDLEVSDNGTTTVAITSVTSLEFSINNSLNPTFVVGESTTPQLEYGMAQIEGTFTAYYEDELLINRFLNETETALRVSINDPSAANEYVFFFPKIKVNGAAVPVDNPQSRIITIPFVALYDDTEQSNLVILRPETA